MGSGFLFGQSDPVARCPKRHTKLQRESANVELGQAAVNAFGTYVAEVRDGSFPAAEQSYKPNAPRTSEPVTVALDAPLALDHWH